MHDYSIILATGWMCYVFAQGKSYRCTVLMY